MKRSILYIQLKGSLLGCMLAVLAISICACGSDTFVQDDFSEESDGLGNQVADEEVPQLDGYDLLWHDEFNGSEMDETIWNYEPHAPGWTNAELQEYTTSTDNIFVKDGRMTLRAIKTQDDKGKDYYTSGKVTTKDKQDFLYGKVVASAKVPEGQGLWPAIWMMPTNQSIYGGWPACGEIDIMEVLGNEADTAYSTIHYGKPHNEQQGKYVLEEGSFADGFHEYSVEWEPGNPDATTDFDKAEFEIDYVRVYQKESYDTDVTKPEKIYREALDDGNYIYNGDFEVAEDLDDDADWSFLLAQGGAADAVIEDGMITIDTKNEGKVDYSVQLVQSQLPMIKGNEYRVTFDACASGDRKMIICVSAPTAGWGRYLPDTSVELTADWQTYTYDFKMKDRDDNNGRLEFNMGSQGSTETIYIRNVRVEQIG